MSKGGENVQKQGAAVAAPRGEELYRYGKPLLPLISRRGFIAAGILSAASVTVRPWQSALAAAAPPPAYKFPWKTFWGAVTLGATIMGYGSLAMLASQFIESIKTKNPEQAASIAGEIASLRRNKFKAPTALEEFPDYKIFDLGGGRVSIPLFHEDGLNGVRTYFAGARSAARLTSPVETTIPGLAEVLRLKGFKKAGALLRPIEQTKMYWSRYQESDKTGEDNRYKSALSALLRYTYESQSATSGLTHVVVENVKDPVTGKSTHYEIPVAIKIDQG